MFDTDQTQFSGDLNFFDLIKEFQPAKTWVDSIPRVFSLW